MAFTEHAPPLSLRELPVEKEPQHLGFQGCDLVSFSSFHLDASLPALYSHLRRAERKKKGSQPAPCSPRLSEGGNWQNLLQERWLKCKFLAPPVSEVVGLCPSVPLLQPVDPALASQPQGLQNSLSTTQSPPKLFQ